LIFCTAEYDLQASPEAVCASDARKPDEAQSAAHEHTMLFQRRFLAYMQQNLTQKMAMGERCQSAGRAGIAAIGAHLRSTRQSGEG
jgi:hypothetical protein